MIVGSALSEGDENTGLKDIQHDVYMTSVGLIVGLRNNYSMRVPPPNNTSDHSSWGTITNCDHRTIQFAHDLLAAVYRYKHSFNGGDLKNLRGKFHAERWSSWLLLEISNWQDSPSLIEYVLIILSNQNQPRGYITESKLCLGILDRFSDVPWRTNLREIFEEDLENELKELNKKTLHPR